MEDKKKEIRKWALGFLIYFVIATIFIMSLAYVYPKFQKYSSNWRVHVENAVIVISLIGLFFYKKWGFYLLTIILIYLIVDKFIARDFIASIMFVIVYGYVWYRGFYKNISYLE